MLDFSECGTLCCRQWRRELGRIYHGREQSVAHAGAISGCFPWLTPLDGIASVRPPS